MKLLHLLLPLVALGFAAVGSAAPSPVRTIQDGYVDALHLTSSDVQDEIDYSIRWLRAQQVLPEGRYGKGVESTAKALLAFAKSPRKYGFDDGPYITAAVRFLVAHQRDDGAMCDEGTKDAKSAARQTQAAHEALTSLSGAAAQPAVATAIERSEVFLASAPLDGDAAALPASAPAARFTAGKLLGMRAKDGSWDGPNGAVVETADAILELSMCASVLKQSEPKEDAGQATPLPAFTPGDRTRVLAAIERGASFLLEHRNDQGLWGAGATTDPGITAMVLGGLLSVPEPRPEEVQKSIDKGIAFLLGLRNEDGSIHDGHVANYTTSVAVMTLARANAEKHAEAIADAKDFLTALQADEGEGYDPSHHFYGGIGYGGDERPDLSNLIMAMEALAAAGLKPGDPAYEKAIVFLQRCQNRSESNDLALAKDGTTIVSGNDGGSAYMPGESKAGNIELPDGKEIPRSYGSMTYALLRGFLFAGLPKDDPRVQAAWKWLQENYTVDVNPGFEASADPTASYQGLFYYFMSMSKALDMYDTDYIEGPDGKKHAWRSELCGRLLAMQRPDGSWVNQNSPRWWEGNPALATAYALLVLDAAMPESEG